MQGSVGIREKSSENPTTEPADHYGLDRWGDGFFVAGKDGHVHVRPDRTAERQADLHEIVETLTTQGLQTPLLLHFGDVLSTVLGDLRRVFDEAMSTLGYRGGYEAVYPVKVNQQRGVVEDVCRLGEGYGFGLEVGSKPELLAVLALTAGQPDRTIICNGFKEDRYVEFTMLATKLGRRIIPVVENLEELRLVLAAAVRLGVRPRLGIRVNLQAQGAGRWADSSGMRAKFGLTLSEVLASVDLLRGHDMLDCLTLLHCHMGSQVHDIRQVVEGVGELTRIYTELRRLGAPIACLDVGGGLGVDYHGSQSEAPFSRNYSLEEYASSVVHRIGSICDEARQPHPMIVTESGRAMVAQQSVLVFDVLGANRFEPHDLPRSEDQIANPGDGDLPRPISDLFDAWLRLSEDTVLECWHDAQSARREALDTFALGFMSLEHRVEVERIFWTLAIRTRELSKQLDPIPEELAPLDASLADVYFGNLSVFQSLPDSWAIGQAFPIMPIHRLDETPGRRATIADLTCDSDGKIDRFVDRDGTRSWLPVHELVSGEPYRLGVFLVGAYQETLGDLHNLFGDTHALHIGIGPRGDWSVLECIEGDSVGDVLGYMQYDTREVMSRLRSECEGSVRDGRIGEAECRAFLHAYEAGIDGYTYLDRLEGDRPAGSGVVSAERSPLRSRKSSASAS